MVSFQRTKSPKPFMQVWLLNPWQGSPHPPCFPERHFILFATFIWEILTSWGSQGRITIDWQCWTGNWCEIRRKDISDESGPNVTCLCFKFPVFFKSSLYLAKVISRRKTLYNLRSYPIVQYALVKNVFIPCSIEQCVLNNIDIPNRITSSLTQQEKGLKVVKIW